MESVRHCKQCGKVVGKYRQTCDECKKKNHRIANERWRKYGKTIYLNRRSGNKPRFHEKKPSGYTFSFKGGKWFWKHDSGLENGPFETLKEARTDMNEALG